MKKNEFSYFLPLLTPKKFLNLTESSQGLLYSAHRTFKVVKVE